MAGTHRENLALSHFGRQMKKERLARGWSLQEMSKRMGGGDYAHLGRVERGVRPPTEAIADACDRVFPERRGWFREYYEESKSWMPPGLRSWQEHEDRAVRLSVWAPGILHGLVQTRDYARTWIETLPGVTADQVAARLDSRMKRQARVLLRDDPPVVTCIVDHAALYRLTDSAEVMAAQMRMLLEVASLPHVRLQVLPATAHAAATSELIIADNSVAYCEHLAAGAVYLEPERVGYLEAIFASIAGECYRVSESLAIIRKAEETWSAVAPDGASQVTAVRTEAALRLPALMGRS